MQDDWNRLEMPYGSIFLSIPTVLDPSLAPEGHHILHIFTTSSMDDWKVAVYMSNFIFTFLISDSLLYEEEKMVTFKCNVNSSF